MKNQTWSYFLHNKYKNIDFIYIISCCLEGTKQLMVQNKVGLGYNFFLFLLYPAQAFLKNKKKWFKNFCNHPEFYF